jgi:murein DD-endopeptidase MepM/ murein hydrolase activator NlpD
VLIKHSNGLISAYAHCEELLVKRGDSVNRGQVIARVGATGGVSEPQLHFELRRGKKPIDPREFLAPAPSAGIAAVPAG